RLEAIFLDQLHVHARQPTTRPAPWWPSSPAATGVAPWRRVGRPRILRAVSLLSRAIPPEFRQLDRRIFAIAAARCINTAGFSIVMPYMALYLNTRLGARMVEVGAVYAVASVCAAAGSLVGGELSDRIGRK